MKHGNFNYQIAFDLVKDPKLRQEYYEYLSKSKSSILQALIKCYYTIFWVPLLVISSSIELVNIDPGSKNHALQFSCIFLLLVFAVVIAACGVIFLLIHVWTQNLISPYFKRHLSTIQIIFMITVTMVHGIQLFRRTMGGECGAAKFWNCNPYASSGIFPVDSALILMFVPLSFITFIRGPVFLWTFVSWILVVAFLIGTSIYLETLKGIVIILVYVFSSIFIMFDFYWQSFIMFYMNRRLDETLKENERLAEDQKATDMRHMVANVAHDLKTPLSSFMTGIDVIGNEIQECDAHIQFLQSQCLQQQQVNESTPHVEKSPETGQTALVVTMLTSLTHHVQTIQDCLKNVHGTNDFMMMTINRCLDYTKASKGLKLTPKFETIHLQECLGLPLTCMSNIQNRIVITLQTIPDSICSHIITDKQWFQENVLCLLSNAVKYSSHGEVTIKATIHFPQEEHERLRQEIAELLPRVSKRYQASGSRNSHTKIVPIVGDEENALPGGVDLSNHDQGYSSEASYIYSDPDIDIDERPRRHHLMRGLLLTSDDTVLTQPIQIGEYKTQPYVLVEIEDTGIGISDEAMLSLFNPFKQTQRLAGGTGLGLYSLAKRIEALNGFYGVRKRADEKQGSCFWFSFPYRPDTFTAAEFAVSTSTNPVTAAAINRATTVFTRPLLPLTVTIPAVQQPSLRNSYLNIAPGTPVHAVNDAPLHILLAEDSPTIVRMTTMLLSRGQCNKITIAENGAVALTMIKDSLTPMIMTMAASPTEHPSTILPVSNTSTVSPRHTTTASSPRYSTVLTNDKILQSCYDCVLMDLQMPVMDGLEATRRLRRYERELLHTHQQYTHTMIIGVSANDDAETMQEAYDAGIDAFIAKPFSLDKFRETLAKLKVSTT